MSDTPEKRAEARHTRTIAREYRNDKIVVYWKPELCIHSGVCVQGLPWVFRPRHLPWVAINAASPDQIAEVVGRCPSGALTYERLDISPQQAAPAASEAVIPETVITPVRNGPLTVRGRLKITDEDGNVLRETTKAVLCRCGHSGHKPFCDGSHARIGFRTDDDASSQGDR
ncbi:MAG: (4Fe-4S)-binding protein [Anaerolineae bacterium]